MKKAQLTITAQKYPDYISLLVGCEALKLHWVPLRDAWLFAERYRTEIETVMKELGHDTLVYEIEYENKSKSFDFVKFVESFNAADRWGPQGHLIRKPVSFSLPDKLYGVKGPDWQFITHYTKTTHRYGKNFSYTETVFFADPDENIGQIYKRMNEQIRGSRRDRYIENYRVRRFFDKGIFEAKYTKKLPPSPIDPEGSTIFHYHIITYERVSNDKRAPRK